MQVLLMGDARVFRTLELSSAALQAVQQKQRDLFAQNQLHS